MQKIKRIALPSLLVLVIVTSCTLQPPLKSTFDAKNPLVSNLKSKTSISGIVEFPEKFKTKATLDEIASNSTVSIIDPGTHKTIATGYTNGSAAFTLNPDDTFHPLQGDIFILEATKRIGDVGNRLMAVRTYIERDNGNWKSITKPIIKINSRTTALSVIKGLNTNTITPGDLIETLDVDQDPPVFEEFGNVTEQDVDNVSGLVNIVLDKESDPISSIKYINSNYVIVNPPNIVPVIVSPSGSFSGQFFLANTTQEEFTNYYQSKASINQSDGSSIVVWSADKHDFYPNYGQKYDSDGMAVGNEIVISADEGGQSPQVAMANNGNFVLAWSRLHNIYARVFNNNGEPISEEINIDSSPAGQNNFVALGINPDTGEFVTAWNSQNNSNNSLGVFAQRFNSDGTPNGSKIPVSTNSSGDVDEFTSIAMDSSGKFIISFIFKGGGQQITKVRRFDATGTAIDPTEFNVSTVDSYSKIGSSVDIDANFNFVVTWATNPTGYAFEIWARVIDNNLQQITPQFKVNDSTESSYVYPKVGVKEDGKFVIAWPGSNSEVFVKKYNANGIELAQESTVIPGDSTPKGYSNLAINKSNGDYLVTWEGYVREAPDEDDPEFLNTYADIFGKFFNF